MFLLRNLCNDQRYLIRSSKKFPRKSGKIVRTISNIVLDDIPSASLADIKKKLRIKGFTIQDGFTSIITQCPLCTKSQEKLYINKTTGLFLCPKCNVHGEWTDLLNAISKTALDELTRDQFSMMRNDNKNFEKFWQNLISESECLNKLESEVVGQAFDKFDLPFQQDTLKTLSDVRIDKQQNKLHFPLRNAIDRIVGCRSLSLDGEITDHGSTNGVFVCKSVRSGKEMEKAVIVPSIKDLLSLVNQKVSGALIWFNTKTLPPLVLPCFEKYNKIFIWPSDWGNVGKVAEKLGAARTCFVKPKEGAMSAFEASKSGQNLQSMISEAKPALHKSITTFEALREDIYRELTNMDKVRGVKWRRFPVLTELIGGHRRGELTVVTGPTGCGKTTLCAEMSLDLAEQGVTTLWGSFEIRNSRLARTMLQQYAGMDLEKNIDRFKEFADSFQKLPIYFLMFHGPQPIKVVMEAVEHAHYVYDINHVVIDNVQFMLGLEGNGNGYTNDRYRMQDELLAAFRAFATRRDTHATLVMHPRKERDADDLSTSSIFGSAKASQEADNVLIIQDKRLMAVKGKKFLQVAKNRFSGDLGIMPLEFDKDGLSYRIKKKPKKVENKECQKSSDESQKKMKKEFENDSYLKDVLSSAGS